MEEFSKTPVQQKPEKTFRELLCEQKGIHEKDFTGFVLKRSLFRRTRLVAPLVGLIYPDFLHHEIRLVERCGRATHLELIQFEVDFYHHKFVTESPWKDVLNFRISGMRLMRLANEVFKRDAERASGELRSLSHVQS